MPNTIPLSEIVRSLEDAVVDIDGALERDISQPAPIAQAENETQITFCSYTGERGIALIDATRAGVILCADDETIRASVHPKKTLIVVRNPRLSFLRLVDQFFKLPKPEGIHPTAVIDAQAVIDPTAYIGPLTYIGNSKVGAGSVIFGSCHIYDKVQIGQNVVIHAGAVIGADGFGYQRNEQGELEKFPHVGGVIIENDVEIGANTCIDKGTLGNTIIREHTKIDNLVHIAHNVEIGRHAVVIANAMIAGSVKIGDYAWVAPSASTRESISIGDHAVLGIASLATKDIPNNTTVMGSPARPIEEFKKLLDALRALIASS